MTDRIAFFDYARDFEIALATGDFARLARHFAPDAVHTVAGEGVFDQDDRGRDAVIEGLRRSVAALDRRFALRVPEMLAGPIRREDGGLWMHWRMTFRHPGVPELEVEGEHVAHYDGGAIARIDERLLGGSDRRANEHLAQHEAALRPAGAPPAALDADGAKRFRRATLRTFVRAYAAAKSQGDAAGALALCAPDFSIETIPFGSASRDRDETARHLALFFAAFPDYRAQTESMAVSGDQVAWWGRISLTSLGPVLGQEPTGKHAELPAFSVFDFRGGELVRERFHFDLPTFRRELGLPRDAFERP
jgi:ketosteroid isomerase-like protein